jgi:MYXO-CTERM domain-containing protein
MTLRPSRGLKGLLAVSALLFPLLTQRPALAGGTVTPAKSQLEDSGSGWKLLVTLKLDKKPPSPHQTYRFLFKPTVIYETFMDDTKPGEQTRRLPQDKSVDALVESLDVGFADAKGDVWTSTKFDFTIRRDRGFQSGEYKVEVKDSDGRTVGRPFTLVLGGKNEMIDRRAMVFAGEKKKKAPPPEDKPPVKDEKPADAAPAEPAAPKPPEDKPAAAPPPEIKQKPGGCGCEVPSGAPAGEGAMLAVVALGIGLSRRRGRRDLVGSCGGARRGPAGGSSRSGLRQERPHPVGLSPASSPAGAPARAPGRPCPCEADR